MSSGSGGGYDYGYDYYRYPRRQRRGIPEYIQGGSTAPPGGQHPAILQGSRPLPLDQMQAVTLDDIHRRLTAIERRLLEQRPDGRLWGWEFQLFGGSETVTVSVYDPTVDSYTTQTTAGTGKNLVHLNFVTGKFFGRAISDTATPFIFPMKPLFSLEIINETPSGASSGSDIKVGLNLPPRDFTTPILVRNKDTYSTGIQVSPTYVRLNLINNQATNTAVDAYVRVIGMT
jgi:hypothetical protein